MYVHYICTVYVTLLVIYYIYISLVYDMCCGSALRLHILRDDVARQTFHPKHLVNSDRVKTMAAPIIKCVDESLQEGYPDWY